MLKIFICHQAKEEREYLEKIITNTILMENLQMEISMICDEPKDVLKKVKENSSPAIYFLGVRFENDANGIVLASQIREFDELGVIIFVTAHIEMSYLAYIYQVEALDYIIVDKLKEIEERIKEGLLKANRKLKLEKNDLRNFKIRFGEKILSLPKDDIIYFETASSPHKLILHSKKDEIEFMGRLKNIETYIGNRFYRCHKSYLINLSKVKEVDIKEKIVVMSNGDKCLVSKRAINELIENI
ncbi:MAG: LytR/AlgR family response regulator transcription factor [Sarcina sp.]